MSRWVRIHTSVFEHGVFADESYSEREAWLWLIANAAWKETRHRVGAAVHIVPAGSLFTTLRELQGAWKWRSDFKVRAFLKLLQSEGMISADANAGKTQISICNYERYQNPHHEDNASGTHGKRTENALKTPVHHYTSEEVGSDEPTSPEPAKAAPVVVALPTVSEGDFPIFEEDVAEWQSAFPAVDVRQQLAAMRQWLIANPTRRKTKRGMRKFVVSWLDRKQNAGGSTSQRATAPPQRERTMRDVTAEIVNGTYGNAAGTDYAISAGYSSGNRGGTRRAVQRYAGPEDDEPGYGDDGLH